MRSAPRRLTLVLVLAVVALGLTACGSATSEASEEAGEATVKGPIDAVPAKAGGLSLGLVTVTRDLVNPVALTTAPGRNKPLYVVEQAGRIRTVNKGRVTGTFLDIRNLVQSGGEQGLLSLAFHPKYKRNGLFYVNYTNTDGDTRVVEYRRRKGRSPVRTRVLLAVDQPYANHNGGQLQFGPDGRLYVGMGDGGDGGDPEERAQDLGSRLGKLLRINVNQQGADWQTVGYGLRNPWRFSFDKKTRDLYIADVGQGDWEEIDFVPRGSVGDLLNFGWDAYEGTHPFEEGNLNSQGRLVQPVFEYNHSGGNCSVTGGYVYRGSRIKAAQGRYFFGDYCSGTVWSLVVRNGNATDVERHSFNVGSLASFGQNARGDLFLISDGGSIYRLVRG